MDVRKVKVQVLRDALCKVTRTVGAHEVPVLESVHGPNAISVLGDTDEVMTIEDVAGEMDRLRTSYGFDNERKASHVELAYGRGESALAAQLKANEVKASGKAGRNGGSAKDAE